MRIDDTAATPTATPPQAPAAPAATSDQFLRLFVAQLENQNPLDPQDGSEFVAQLAQFTTVEQAAETNRQLGDILAGQMSTSNAALAGFVGKTGSFAGDRFTVSGHGQGVPVLGIDLDASASKLEVIIRDSQGNQVKRFDLGQQSAGRTTLPWDGTGDNGAPLVNGDYQIEVTATTPDGAAVAGHPILTGRIEALDFIDGVPRLRMGAVSATPSAILSIE